MNMKLQLSMAALATAVLLAACGGGSNNSAGLLPIAGTGTPGADSPVAAEPIPARKIDYCEAGPGDQPETGLRSEEHTSELQSL